MNNLNLITEKFLHGLGMTVSFADGGSTSLSAKYSLSENGQVYDYEGNGVTAKITVDEADSAAVFSISLKSEKPLASKAVTFAADPSFADSVLDYHMDLVWWGISGYPKTADDIKDQTYAFLFETNGTNIAVTNLAEGIFFAKTDSDGMHLITGLDTYNEIEGYFLSVAENSDPITAVNDTYTFGREIGAINIPLRDERSFPELFEDFGWCSWNAFYQNVTSAGLYSKLEEFKSKNVPVKWIIIDDGWSLIRDGKLASFDTDPVKFPEGLAECIRKIKEEYGVKGVGVWHTINGYWQGIDPESEIGKEYAEYLDTLSSGMVIPSTDPDKGYVFWNAFHSHLADCGVDFVKVDNQSSTYNYLPGNTSVFEGVVGIHEGIEQSIAENFGGKVINCMGMNMPNVLARPFTAISRNSDDFFPNRENGFSKHLRQNLYCAVWHTNIYYGDYDMWWSDKANPVESGVLRAISGGTVYVSDEVGTTNPGNLLPVCGKDGCICRMDSQAKPTTDCMYADCETADAPMLKAYNYAGDAFALAVYNICNELDSKTETFKFKVIPGIANDKQYVAYEYFTKKFSLVTADSEETVTMNKGEVKAYSLYPVTGEGDEAYIELGECDRYFGIASAEKNKVLVNEIIA